jgi:glycosyltransferase involved in cell wall biosynthesis
MACGCPVVTSDRSAMVEVTAGAAMLINPNDAEAIARAVGVIIDDQVIRSTMRESGLLRAKQLKWSEFARANLALYRRALRGEPSRVNNSATIALSARINRIFNRIRAPFRRMIS